MRFSEIIGQIPIKNYLVNTVKNSRVSHAQLFLGAEGSGKLALAIAYAQFISCTNKQYDDSGSPLAGDSCGVCPSCLKFNKLIHPDIHFFYPVTTTKDVKTKPKSVDFIQIWRNLLIKNDYYISLNDWYETIGVENKQGIINAEDCDEIVKKLSLKSYESEYKIIILWMVEKLYHAAAPKILKILEEPPEKTLFILVAENHEQVINTIISRTQMVKIPRLGAKDISNALSEKYQATEINARKIANVSDGNFVVAKTLLQEVDEDDYNFNSLQKWLRLCYRFNNDDVFELNKFIDEISKIGRENQKIFFNYALKIIRNTSLMNHGNEKLLKLVEDETVFVKNFSAVLTAPRIPYFADEFNKAVFHIERNANPKVLFMDLSFRLNQIMHS
ncbi:MAG TPA: DNA polymerase III subunit delta [Bacteroidales bacterium]|nr:DNA polymerase III subunit delta [Bacteroidales bacterium]